MLSQSPPRKPRSLKARPKDAGDVSSAGAERWVEAQPASPSATSPTAPNVARMLTSSAIAPNIGPTMAPKTAAPNAVPISSPRRSRGAATVSQANAPAQVVVLENPWTKRARPSVQAPAAANAKLASDSRTSRRGPPVSARTWRRRSRPGCRRRAHLPRTRRRGARRPPWRARTRPRSRERAARALRTASRPRARSSRPGRAAASPADVTLERRNPRTKKPAGGDGDSFRGVSAKSGPLPRPGLSCAINSASRVRFRPPPRRTFGFRLRPPGVDSTYSRPVLAARSESSAVRPGQGPERPSSQFATFSFHPIHCGFATCYRSRQDWPLVALSSFRGVSANPGRSRGPDFLRNKFSEPVAVSSAPPTDVSASAYTPSGGAST